MSDLKDGFDLISMMVDETFSAVEEDTPISCEREYGSSGSNYTRIPKTPVLEAIQLEFHFEFFLGGYDQERKCFIFQIEEEVLEIPQNWGPFKLSTFKDGRVEDLFKLEKHEDLDNFFEILSHITHKSFKSLRCINCGTHLKMTYELDEEQQLAEVIPFNQISIPIAA